jgi:NADPH2:quinone reductase
MNNSVLIRETGDVSVMRFEPAELRTPENHEVLVRQEAIGVNFVDTMVRSGTFPVRLPAVLGFEAAGIVEAVGSASTRFKIGDRVGYFFAPGAYADYNLVNVSALVALPEDITTLQSAAFLGKGLTAWMGLRALHNLKAGETILVQGASGSVGSLLTRWAHRFGAKVIGVAGSPSKLPSLNASTALALSSADPHFLDKIRALEPRGVDVVYDFVGGATFPGSLAAVRDGGKILTIGAASGQALIDKATIAQRSIEVRGGGTPQYVNGTNQADAADELFSAIRQGLFNDIEIRQHPLKDAHLVHQSIESRLLTGLNVLIP